jgi:hypothetical protein
LGSYTCLAMLEDFDPTKTIDAKAKPRSVAALSLAVLSLGSLFTVMVVLSKQPSAPVEEVETEVTFEDAPIVPDVPEVVPEPEQAPPENFDPRPAAIREAMLAPTEIPDEQLEESEAPLEAVGDTGPISGAVGGNGGTGALVRQALGPPAEEEDDEEASDRGEHFSIEDATRPRLIDGCRSPSFPNDPTLVGQTVRVRCMIGVEGTTTCTVLCGPESARAAALECVHSRRYEAARYPDGTATAFPQPIQFVIGGI